MSCRTPGFLGKDADGGGNGWHARLGVTVETDVAVIGAGPVGLFAVFQCGMLRMRCVVVDALDAIGGQCAALYPEKPIFDIPAHPEIEGGALIHKLEAQAAPSPRCTCWAVGSRPA